MASIIDTLKTKLGVPGRRKYETSPIIPPFSGMTEKEKLQSIVLQLRLRNREQRTMHNLTWYQMVLYYRGRQNLGLNQSGTAWDVYENEEYFCENQSRKHIDTVVQILNRSEGDVVVRPASDNPQDLAKSRAADPILSMQRDNIGYDQLLDIKNLYKCLFGNAFTFTDYIKDKKYGSIVTPKYSYEPQALEDGTELLSKVVSGYDTQHKGKQIATVCSPLEINVDVTVRPFSQAPYLQWISRQDRDLINYYYPGLNISSGVSPVEVDLAQQYIDVLSNLPGSLSGDLSFARGSSMQQKVELVRSWLQPCTFQGDSALEKAYPDGVHVTTINGLVIDWYPEDLTARWTHEVLIPVPFTLLGDGLYDMISMQDQINEMNSLTIKHTKYSTVSHKVYDSQAIDPKDFINDPEFGLIPAKVPLDGNVSGVIKDLPPSQLSQDVSKWKASLLQSMQDMTGAYDPVTGKGLGANTPYSQSVFLAERAQSRWQGSLSYNRPELIRFHEILLEDARKNWQDLQQRAVIDNVGQWSFQQFSQADLQGDVDIIFSNTDSKPKNRAEQVQAVMMLQQLAPLLPVLPPKQKLRIEELMGLPPDANPMSGQIARAYRMIDRIKKGETISPLPLVDEPSMQVPVFADFLASEDGEALAESDPQTFANIYTYMSTLMMMGVSQMGSPGGQMAAQIGGRAPQQQSPGGAPAGESGQDPKTAGGQPGQKGGGANSVGQPQAQSPAPAPPVQPPSPS